MLDDAFFRSLETKAITDAAGGDVTVLTVPAGRTFHLMGLFLIAEGATDLTFKSGTTALSGAMELADTHRLDFPVAEIPYVSGAATGDDFIINNSAAVQISGFAQFFVEAT